MNHDYITVLGIIIPLWAILIKTSNLASIPRSRTYLSMFFSILNINLVGFIVLLGLKYIIGFSTFSHYFLLAFSLINTILLFAVLLLLKVLNPLTKLTHNTEAVEKEIRQFTEQREQSEHLKNSLVE